MSEWEMPEIIAIQKWVAKKIPNYSTGIDESLTCGYGELDELGFWEYPLPPEFHGKVPIKKAERDAQEERVRELEEELDAHTEMLTDVWKRAIKMWQDETGRTDTWPDGAQHYAYLMGKITELEAENERLRERVRELESAIRIGSEEIHKDDGDYALGMKTLIEAIGGKYPAADYKTEPTTIADIIAQHKKGPQRGRRG